MYAAKHDGQIPTSKYFHRGSVRHARTPPLPIVPAMPIDEAEYPSLARTQRDLYAIIRAKLPQIEIIDCTDLFCSISSSVPHQQRFPADKLRTSGLASAGNPRKRRELRWSRVLPALLLQATWGREGLEQVPAHLAMQLAHAVDASAAAVDRQVRHIELGSDESRRSRRPNASRSSIEIDSFSRKHTR